MADTPTLSSQQALTQLCAQTALLLSQHGAESALVESMARRAGVALGMDRVDLALLSSAVIVTTLRDDRSVTVVRRNEDHAINMHAVVEVQRAVLDLEAELLDAEGFRARIAAVKPLRYSRWLVAPAIGLSCAAFARLAGADLVSCGVALAASGLAMFVRLRLAALHFNPLLNFFITAFIATTIAAGALRAGIGLTPKVAMAASVLMLVPGFPYINAVSDMVKGYMNTGITRWGGATFLSAATCSGILLAMHVWNIWGWL